MAADPALLPVRVKVYPAGSASKNVRAADALDHYNRGLVEHAPGLREAEGQMVAFPKAPHDDLVDAVGAGVRYFLSRGKKRTCGNVWIPRALCELSVEIDVLLWMLDDAFVGCGRGQP